MILELQQGLAQEGVAVSMVKLCKWFGLPRRTAYYRSTKAAKIQEGLPTPIRAMIEEYPSFGYRTTPPSTLALTLIARISELLHD